MKKTLLIAVMVIGFSVNAGTADAHVLFSCPAGQHLGTLTGTFPDFHRHCVPNVVVPPPAPVDVCPEAGMQTTGPCESEDICPNDTGIQTAPHCQNVAPKQATGRVGGSHRGGDAPRYCSATVTEFCRQPDSSDNSAQIRSIQLQLVDLLNKLLGMSL